MAGKPNKNIISNWDYDERMLLLEKIGNQWKFLMRFIDVEEERIVNICASSHNAKINEQAYSVLEKKLQEKKIIWEQIENALKLLEQFQLMAELKKKLNLPIVCNSSEDASGCNSLKCSDNVLAVVAFQIKNYWKILAKSMNFSSDEISTIEEDNQSYPVEEKAYQFLWGLKRKFSEEEVLSDVRYAMLKCFPTECKKVFNNLHKSFSNENLKNIFSDEVLIEIDEQNHHVSYGCEDDFYIVSHSSEREQKLVKGLIDKLNKNMDNYMSHTITFETGKTNVLNLAEFHDYCCNGYVDRYFENSKFFTFNCNHDDENFVAGFKHFLKKQGSGFMIKDYNLMKHFKFSGMQEEYAMKDDHFSTYESSHKMDYIAIEKNYRVIYFVKKSGGKSLKDLKQDIKDSAAYLRMFFLLHNKSLMGKISAFISIVVIPTKSEPLINKIHDKCKYCDTFVMTEDTFKHFDDNVEDGLLEKLLDYIQSKTLQTLRKNEFDKYKYMFANIFGFMASQPTDLIPCLSEKVSKQIDNAIILFNPTQLEISNSKDKRVLLIGDYGSGKTLVARSLIKTLTFNLEPHDYIHYVNFGSSNDLTKDMQKFANKHDKQKIICISINQIQDGSKLLGIMALIKEIHKKFEKIHFIFDEAPINEWTKFEILQFIKILKVQQFIDSHFLIICQPMQKERVYTPDGIKFIYPFKEQVSMLSQESNFQKKELDEIFRNTNKIAKLGKYTINILKDHKNKYHQGTLNNLSENEDFKSKPGIDTVTRKIKPLVGMEKSNDAENIVIGKRKQQGAELFELNSPENSEAVSSVENRDNFDLRLKSIEKFGKNDTNSKATVESIYSYCSNGKTIHKITGEDPILYFPFDKKDSYDDFEKIYLVGLCLQNIVRDNKMKKKDPITILHFEDKTPIVLQNALNYLEGKLQFKNLSMKSVVEAQGCEYDNVIIYLSTTEYHLRHYLVEAITRCKCNLIFIVIKEEWKLPETNVVQDMIQNWEQLAYVSKVPFEDLNYEQSCLDELRKNYAKHFDSHHKEITPNISREANVLKRHLESIEDEAIPSKRKKQEINDLHDTIQYLCENDDVDVLFEFMKIHQLDVVCLRVGGDDESLLHISVRTGGFNITHFLLSQYQFDVNVRNRNQETPLLIASMYGHVDIVHLLINNNADIYAKDEYGRSPLHVASSIDVAHLLVKNNADIHAKDGDGYTPLDRARQSNKHEIVQFLEQQFSQEQ